MAIYEYEILNYEGAVVGIYEAEQKMSEAALTEHPDTGLRLRRILSATFAHRSSSASGGACASGSCGVGSNFDSGGGCSGGSCGWN